MNAYNWKSDFPEPPENFHNKLCSTLAQLPDKEEATNMNRKMTLKSVLVFTAVAILALATTVYAAGKIYTVSHSSNVPTYTQIPTASQAQKVLNASPKLIEKFDNGYAFKAGYVGESSDVDEAGGVLRNYQDLDLRYTNGTETVSLFMKKAGGKKEISQGFTEITYQGIDLQMYAYTSKTVPFDYVKTEQELRDEAAGKLIFGTMGEDTITTSTEQILFWDDGGVSYSLLASDNGITSEEILGMAKELIDFKKS